MKPIRFNFLISLFVVGILISGCASHTSPQVSTTSSKQELTIVKKTNFDLSELLKRKDLETITVVKDPGYGYTTTKYTAVRASQLFKSLNIPKTATLKFICLDGFSASVPATKILNNSSKKAVAYIAIEDPKNPWPPVKLGKPSAGPFYLVWLRPELSGIVTHDWPFQVKSVEIINPEPVR